MLDDTSPFLQPLCKGSLVQHAGAWPPGIRARTWRVAPPRSRVGQHCKRPRRRGRCERLAPAPEQRRAQQQQELGLGQPCVPANHVQWANSGRQRDECSPEVVPSEDAIL
jgi:hypothetical protein